MTQGGPQFPDVLGLREAVRPGATTHKAGLSVEQRLQALEQGAMGVPGPGVVDGSIPAALASAHGNVTWTERTTPYYAAMYAANSGAPTHTSSGGWQKVGSGGGTLTWTSAFDIRPSGVSAQVDTATNKRIDIRKTGVYRIAWSVAFTSITDAKVCYSAVYRDGSQLVASSSLNGVAGPPILHGQYMVSLTSGSYLELYANQNDSASEAYDVSNNSRNYLSIEYIGPAS